MKKFKKIFVIFLIFSFLILFFNVKTYAVSADNETSNVSNEAIENSSNTTNNSEDESSDVSSNNETVEDNSNEIQTTSTPTENNPSSAESQTINSYSTVSTIPEANLGLNNILNILLIAIGILMILLGIAILIRLKNER